MSPRGHSSVFTSSVFVASLQSITSWNNKNQLWQHSGTGWRPQDHQEEPPLGTSLVVQWLRLHTSNARGTGSIPGQGTKPHMPNDVGKKGRGEEPPLESMSAGASAWA